MGHAHKVVRKLVMCKEAWMFAQTHWTVTLKKYVFKILLEISEASALKLLENPEEICFVTRVVNESWTDGYTTILVLKVLIKTQIKLKSTMIKT